MSTPELPLASPTIRAVVVTWRGSDSIVACIDSLLQQEVDADLEVLVVDNASDDGTAELLAGFGSRILVRRMARNLGFAGGVARGTDDCPSDFILLLNDDATLEKNALQELLRFALAPGSRRVGAVAAQILLAGKYSAVASGTTGALVRSDGVHFSPDPSGDLLVNSTGSQLDRAGRGSDRDWLVPIDMASRNPEVFGFCGGATLLRAAALQEVGGFDRDLFLYYEDTDVSWRLRARGWTVAYCSQAVAHHRHASSSGVESAVFRYYNTRNALRVAVRYAPFFVIARAWARAGAGAVRAMVRREPTWLERWRGMRDALTTVPEDLRVRSHWATPERDAAADRFVGAS